MTNDPGKAKNPERARDDLAADLESIGAAWSMLNREQPPELLDQAVLNAARRAADTAGRGQSRPWFRRRRWLGGLAAAAVIVLAVTLVIEQGAEAPTPQPSRSDGHPLPRPIAAPMAETRSSADEVAETLEETGDAAAKGPARRMAAPLENRAAEQAAPDPEAWIERLRRLKADGETTVFRAELAAFRAAYPDYALPPELME
jgi:hypothetical protein